MKKLFGHIAALALLVIAGCTGQDYPPSLIVADSLLQCRPDSALAIADSLLSDSARLSRGQLMRCRLLRLSACNKLDTVFTAAHAAQAEALADYFDRHGTPNEQLRAHYILGRTYADMGETPRAVDCYLDAVAKADTTAADCDYATLSRVYSQMGRLFYQQLLSYNELYARRKARKYFLCAKDTFNAIYQQGMIGGTYIILNKRDSAEILLRKTIRQYRAYGYTQNALQVSTMLMQLYVDQHDRLSELKQLLDQYDSKSEQFDACHNLSNAQRIFFYYKGKYYDGINRLDSAEFYYRKMFYPRMSWTYQNSMYKGLLSVFRKRHQADSIAKYAELYGMANDSSIIRKDQQQTALMTASYDYGYYKKQLIKKSDVAQKRLNLLYTMTIVIAILIIVGIEYHHRNAKQRQEKQAEIRLLRSKCVSLNESLINKEQELLSLEDNYKKTVKTIEDEIESINRESTNNAAKYLESQHIIQKLNVQHDEDRLKLCNEISKRMEEISNLEHKISIYAGAEHATPFLKLGVVKRTLLYADKPDRKLSEDDLNSLLKVTKECYPDFIRDMRHAPKIGELGVKVCILIALNIKPRDIGHLLDMPYNQISNIKQDLNQGLFNENTARTLYQNLCMRYHIMSC